MEHARLGKREVEALPRARYPDVHQAAFLLEPLRFRERVLMREEPLFKTGNEHMPELETLGRVRSHHLHCIVAALRLMLASFQRCMGKKGCQRRKRLAGGFGIHRHQSRGCLQPKSLLLHEGCRSIDQFGKVLDPIVSLPLQTVVLDQATFGNYALHRLGKGQQRGFPAEPRNQLLKTAQAAQGRPTGVLS